MDPDNVQPVEKVRTEQPPLHLLLQIAVRGYQQPEIQLNAPGAGQPLNGLFLNELQQLGMTYRKADHIRSLSQKVFDGPLVLDRLYGCSDSEVIRQLSPLDGIGPWTAEMVLAFCMQRPDVFSFGDLGIHKGLRMLHGLPKIDRVQFEELRRRYSPCGTTASLYLWELSLIHI